MFTLTKEQQEVFNSDSKMKLVVGERRSGKTVLVIEEIKRVIQTPNAKVLYVGPNFASVFDEIYPRVFGVDPSKTHNG